MSAGGDSSGEEGGLQIDMGGEEGVKSEASSARKTVKAEADKWKPGDIVWAKVSGFNYWPAKVFDASDSKCVPKWLSTPPKPHYNLVRFFGSYDMQWVSQRLIETYEKGCKKKFQNKCRSKLFQKSVKEVRGYVEDGVVPEGLTHSIQDPDAEEDKGEESVGVVSANDGAPTKESKNKKSRKVDSKAPPTATVAQQPLKSDAQSTNGSRSRRRKGSPRRLSSSSVDNDDANPPKRAKLDSVDEATDSTMATDKETKGDEVEAFTSAPLPLSSNKRKKSPRTKAVEV